MTPEIDLEFARRLLSEAVQSDGSLYRNNDGIYIVWKFEKPTVMLDGSFTVDQLHAIAYWMKWCHEKKQPRNTPLEAPK